MGRQTITLTFEKINLKKFRPQQKWHY